MDLLQLSILADEIKKYSVGSHKFFFTFFFFYFFPQRAVGRSLYWQSNALLYNISPYAS